MLWLQIRAGSAPVLCAAGGAVKYLILGSLDAWVRAWIIITYLEPVKILTHSEVLCRQIDYMPRVWWWCIIWIQNSSFRDPGSCKTLNQNPLIFLSIPRPSCTNCATTLNYARVEYWTLLKIIHLPTWQGWDPSVIRVICSLLTDRQFVTVCNVMPGLGTYKSIMG